MAFAILPGVDILAWTKNVRTVICTHILTPTEAYSQTQKCVDISRWYILSYTICSISCGCGTDDDENNITNNKKDGWVVFVTLVQLSYPPYFLPVVYPLLHDYGKCWVKSILAWSGTINNMIIFRIWAWFCYQISCASSLLLLLTSMLLIGCLNFS